MTEHSSNRGYTTFMEEEIVAKLWIWLVDKVHIVLVGSSLNFARLVE